MPIRNLCKIFILLLELCPQLFVCKCCPQLYCPQILSANVVRNFLSATLCLQLLSANNVRNFIICNFLNTSKPEVILFSLSGLNVKIFFGRVHWMNTMPQPLLILIIFTLPVYINFVTSSSSVLRTKRGSERNSWITEDANNWVFESTESNDKITPLQSLPMILFS
uniref:Uncharacterized protein n=1 Tax=Meloidogyne enterolobii TaxID=390850 RepID=A0A6V7U1K7_MELEN|nr:unnamed protein product [Meloidogyne enterolobii]